MMCVGPAQGPVFHCPAASCLSVLSGAEEGGVQVNKLQGWGCPRCRGDCNCSNCRKVREGAACWLGPCLVSVFTCLYKHSIA